MRGGRMVLAAVAAGALALGGGAALASTWTATASGTAAPRAPRSVQLHGITGKVVAVQPASRILVVQGAIVDGQKNATVSVKVPGKSDIRQGWFHKRLANIKPGNHVWMVYQGTPNNWIADHIRIQEPVVSVMGVEGPDIRTS